MLQNPSLIFTPIQFANYLKIPPALQGEQALKTCAECSSDHGRSVQKQIKIQYHRDLYVHVNKMPSFNLRRGEMGMGWPKSRSGITCPIWLQFCRFQFTGILFKHAFESGTNNFKQPLSDSLKTQLHQLQRFYSEFKSFFSIRVSNPLCKTEIPKVSRLLSIYILITIASGQYHNEHCQKIHYLFISYLTRSRKGFKYEQENNLYFECVKSILVIFCGCQLLFILSSQTQIIESLIFDGFIIKIIMAEAFKKPDFGRKSARSDNHQQAIQNYECKQ